MSAEILVVGGAGYIGSHMVNYLRRTAYRPVVLDNLSTGHQAAVGDAEFIRGDIGDAELLDDLFSRRIFTAVMHFAAFSLVAESVREPEKYHTNNVVHTRTLLEAMVRHKQPRFIFSSTAAVYGNPDSDLIKESHKLRPINPYGETKKFVEIMLSEFAGKYGLLSGSLRYFNAAGADPSGNFGECHEPETHLIPLVLQAASGRRASISMFGDDYLTPDGTCVRDYIHVNDLAEAHYKLLQYMLEGGKETVFNLGTGQGYSVKEVIETARRVTGKPILAKMEGRRPGDPAILVADGSKARQELGWEPQCSDLETIIRDAWRWEQSLSQKSPQ